MDSNIPYDDDQLEMEDVDLFYDEPKRTPEKSSNTKKHLNHQYSNRWAYSMLVIGFVIGILLKIDTTSLNFWESNGGEHIEDIVIKAPTISPQEAAEFGTIATENSNTNDSNANKNDSANEINHQNNLDVPKEEPTKKEENPPKEEPTKEDPPPQQQQPKADTAASTATYIDYGAEHYPKPSYVVKPEKALSSEKEKELITKWGKWDSMDEKKKKVDKKIFDEYDNQDIPFDKFPSDAWQMNKEFLKDKFLPESLNLVKRAMESILEEYGHPPASGENGDATFEERSKMFTMIHEDEALKNGNNPGTNNVGGWTTTSSWNGLVRRVLHAIVTEDDDFTVILGGHSAAAGHGNLFIQSYIMQFHKVMEPIFSMLGIQLKSHNLARGGMGTIQDSLGMKDMYGDNIDMLIWDSGMTEGRDLAAVDYFMRMAILSGGEGKVPFVIGNGERNRMAYYYQKADLDIASLGTAMDGIIECTSEEQCQTLPYAIQYMKCDNPEFKPICNKHKFHSNCWVDRPDVTPPKQQAAHPGSQVGWHPGNRMHQLTGRILAFTVLRAIKEALTIWQNAENFVLSDDVWHVTSHYKNIRTKTRDNTSDAKCYDYKTSYDGILPDRLCDIPLSSRSEFTPRRNPELTSLTGIMEVAPNGYKPYTEEPLLYDGPNVYNPYLAVPDNDIDVLSIISLGRKYDETRRTLSTSTTEATTMDQSIAVTSSSSYNNNTIRLRRNLAEKITSGLGWYYTGQANGYCDGSYNNICNRNVASTCLLSGHNDIRGGLVFHSFSGWGKFILPVIEHGIILMKYENWHNSNNNPITKGWKSINNERRKLVSSSDENRDLKKAIPPPMCDAFKLEYVIDNGPIQFYNKETTKYALMQRVAIILPLLDDTNWKGKKENVEVAIRMTGCGNNNSKAWSLTHLYYA